MKISIFGLGYVGCVSAGCLTKSGHEVIGIDVSKTKADLINQGIPTIIEKDIDILVADSFKKGLLKGTTDYMRAVTATDVSIICVGTPNLPSGHLDLSHIYEVAKQIGEALKHKQTFHVVSIRSTVFPGTNIKVGEIIEKVSGKNRNVDFAVVSNPEFLREGTAVKDYYSPPYTVIGSDNDTALDIMEEIYSDINAQIIKTDMQVAELLKYINNTFHALKVSFSNEIGNVCKKLGIDSHELMNIFIKDTHLNISPYYMKPGFAFGGSCLPKDLRGFNALANDNYLDVPVINSILESNEYHKNLVLDKILNYQIKKIGILGLSFKSGTDDLRESPIIDIIERLIGKGFLISIYDKNVNLSKLLGANKEYIEKKMPHLSNLISDNLSQIIDESDLLVITYKEEGFIDIIKQYTEKRFLDLARIEEDCTQIGSLENYEGICW